MDWMNSVRNTKQRAQAKAVLTWLLATDRKGHGQATARRLGVMYIIWNNRIYSLHSSSQGWRPYNNCANRTQHKDDTACHRDHIHLSLSWEGAMARTSFWSRSVASRDYGPCRPRDLNWAAPRTRANAHRCPQYPRVTAPHGASKTRKALTAYSGMVLRDGSRGAAVTVVQKVVRTTADGNFGPVTATAVAAWQRAHHVPASGVVDATTWRALLKAVH